MHLIEATPQIVLVKKSYCFVAIAPQQNYVSPW